MNQDHIITSRKYEAGRKKSLPDILIDIARFGDKLLESLKDAVSFFFLLDKTDIKKEEKAASRIIGVLRDLKKEYTEIFRLLVRYITGLLKYKGVEIETISDYIDNRGESMLAQSIDELKEQGRVEGRDQGIERGIEQERRETTRKMLAEGLDIKMISHITGFSLSEIEKLK